MYSCVIVYACSMKHDRGLVPHHPTMLHSPSPGGRRRAGQTVSEYSFCALHLHSPTVPLSPPSLELENWRPCSPFASPCSSRGALQERRGEHFPRGEGNKDAGHSGPQETREV